MGNEYHTSDEDPNISVPISGESNSGEFDSFYDKNGDIESGTPGIFPELVDPEVRDIRDVQEEVVDMQREIEEIQSRIRLGDNTAADDHRLTELTIASDHYTHLLGQLDPENTDRPDL
jgi:hypothetical protein